MIDKLTYCWWKRIDYELIKLHFFIVNFYGYKICIKLTIFLSRIWPLLVKNYCWRLNNIIKIGQKIRPTSIRRDLEFNIIFNIFIIPQMINKNTDEGPVLLVCVYNRFGNIITHDYLYQLFIPYGEIVKILIFEKAKVWKTFIEFKHP